MCLLQRFDQPCCVASKTRLESVWQQWQPWLFSLTLCPHIWHLPWIWAICLRGMFSSFWAAHNGVILATLLSTHTPCEAFTTRKQQIRWWVGDLRTLKLLSTNFFQTTCCLNRRTGQVWRFQEQVDCWLCKNCLRLPVLTVLSGYLWVKLGSLECTWMFSQQAPDQCWIICLFNVIFVILYNTLDFIRKLKNYSHLFTGLAV